MLSDPTVLERRCRLLLRAYPPAYRDRWGEEIVATLLDAAGPGRRRPQLADATDVLAAGVRQRLGPAGVSSAAGLRLAAPFALALAAGISAYLWWWVEPATVHTGGLPGPWRTTGPIAYAAWLVAAIAVALRPSIGRAAVGTALVLTLLLPAAAALTTVDRPPVWVLMVLGGLGAVALTGQVTRLSPDERLAVPAGAVAVASIAAALGLFWPGAPGYYQPTIARVGVVVGLTAAVALVLATRPGRPAQSWLWAATLLALLAGWLGPVEVGTVGSEAGGQRFGRLAEVLLASCVAAATLAWLGRPRATGRPELFAGTGSVVVGTGAGMAAFLGTGGTFTGYAWVTVGAVALAGLCCLAAARRVRGWWLGAGAAFGLGAAWTVAAYDNGWSLRGWTDPARTADLVCTVAFVPLFLCAAVVARTLHRPGRRVARTGALLVSLAWLGPATLPYAARWLPELAVLLACAGVLAISRRRSV